MIDMIEREEDGWEVDIRWEVISDGWNRYWI
jgi:hypothetical protein